MPNLMNKIQKYNPFLTCIFNECNLLIGGCLATTEGTQKTTTTTKCKTICSTQQPFMITFNTDGLEGTDEQKGVNQKDIGFRLSYIQSSSPC